MPTLALTNFNIVVTVLGGWISLFGLVSYLVKENFYLSEARRCPHPLFLVPQPPVVRGSPGDLSTSCQEINMPSLSQDISPDD